jgi:hypothetical protein
MRRHFVAPSENLREIQIGLSAFGLPFTIAPWCLDTIVSGLIAGVDRQCPAD